MVPLYNQRTESLHPRTRIEYYQVVCVLSCVYREIRWMIAMLLRLMADNTALFYETPGPMRLVVDGAGRGSCFIPRNAKSSPLSLVSRLRRGLVSPGAGRKEKKASVTKGAAEPAKLLPPTSDCCPPRFSISGTGASPHATTRATQTRLCPACVQPAGPFAFPLRAA